VANMLAAMALDVGMMSCSSALWHATWHTSLARHHLFAYFWEAS